jgi:uncharacterized membrane protein
MTDSKIAEGIQKGVRNPYFLLLLITILAAVLRFYKLGEWSFWKDEIFTLGPKADGLHLSFLGESLVRYLVKWVVSMIGVNEWSARLVPAVIGVITIPILFFPLRTLFGDNPALLTLAMVAVSPWHIYWSQTTRFYILLMLFASLALLLLAISVVKGRPWAAIAALVFFFLAVRESLIGLFLVPIVLIYLALLWFTSPNRQRPKLWILLTLLIVGGAMALYISLPYWKNLPAWMQGFGRVNNSPMWILSVTVYYIGVPAVIIGLFSALNLFNKRVSLSYLLAPWAWLPLVAIMIFATFQYTASRYIFISLPAWLILASLAAIELYAAVKNSARLLALGVIVLLLAAPLSEDYLYYYYQNGNRENGKAAYGFIREHIKPGDLVVASDSDVGDYYLGQQTIPMSSFDPNRIDPHQRVWFVEDLDASTLYPGLMHWVWEHAGEAANFDERAAARLFTMGVYFYNSLSGNG